MTIVHSIYAIFVNVCVYVNSRSLQIIGTSIVLNVITTETNANDHFIVNAPKIMNPFDWYDN